MRSLVFALPALAACAVHDQAVCASADQCADYAYTSEYWRLDLAEDFCDGTFTYGGTCPTDGAVATCTFNGEFATSVYTYYAPDFTAETAQTECETVVNGTFAAI